MVMKTAKLASQKTSHHPRVAAPVSLGKYIVADPEICHGKPTFKGTRIMVWQVLDALARGESWEEIVEAWNGGISREAIAETVRLARSALLDNNGRLLRGVTQRLAA